MRHDAKQPDYTESIVATSQLEDRGLKLSPEADWEHIEIQSHFTNR